MNDQLILKFPQNKNFLKEDFYVSQSNQEAYDFIDSWPKWIKRIVNIFGPTGSGKTHIASILKNKTSFLEVKSDSLSDEIFLKFKTKELLIIENQKATMFDGKFHEWIEKREILFSNTMRTKDLKVRQNSRDRRKPKSVTARKFRNNSVDLAEEISKLEVYLQKVERDNSWKIWLAQPRQPSYLRCLLLDLTGQYLSRAVGRHCHRRSSRVARCHSGLRFQLIFACKPR